MYNYRHFVAFIMFLGGVVLSIWSRQPQLIFDFDKPIPFDSTLQSQQDLASPSPVDANLPEKDLPTAIEKPVPTSQETEVSGPKPTPTSTVNSPLSPTPTQVFLPVVIGGSASSQMVLYVAENGDDNTGDGSNDNPWGTITFALSQAPDGSIVLVKPGTYIGDVSFDRLLTEGITLRSEVPYMAKLRNNDIVLKIFFGRGLAVEGFDISHIGPGAGRYVIQIQDPDGNHQFGSDVVLRNNFIHDSYNNDLVKVNNNASHIVVEGNVFYNMGGPETDSHLDINSVDYVVIQDNIFFNDYEGSSRVNENISGHFIVVKDSNGDTDGHLGSKEIIIRRNIFMNWQGKQGNAFIGLGDGTSVAYYQARGILIENNLMLGNSTNKIHAVLKVVSAQDVVFRNNTIVGDLPANAYFMRADVANPSFLNNSFEIYNNIWADATGTMGADISGEDNDFSITPANSIQTFVLGTNLYWNGPNPVPGDAIDLIQFQADLNPILQNPLLPAIPVGMPLPRLDPDTGLIGGQFHSIREAFIYLVQTYGTPALGSPVIDQADPLHAAVEDILGRSRLSNGEPDVGAVEIPK